LGAVKSIVDREGISGLFAGLDSALFGISVTNFVYYYCMLHTPSQGDHKKTLLLMEFTGYEWTRSSFERAALSAGRPSKRLTALESMAAGALAGSATVLITNPIWVVNTRMTARKNEADDKLLPGSTHRKQPSTFGTLMAIIQDEGLSSLFAGVMPALVLVINPILQYTIFEQLKNVLERRRKVGPTDSFYLGAIGKLLATSITYPYITVKSRAHVAGKNAKNENMFASFQRILKEEGWAGLYGGKYRPTPPWNDSNLY